jgi:hypothetical protein
VGISFIRGSVVTILLLIQGACANKKATPGVSAAAQGASASVTDTSSGAVSSSNTAPSSQPPAFATASLPGGALFNQSAQTITGTALPANANVLVLHTRYYRPIFLDLLDSPPREDWAIYQPLPTTIARISQNQPVLDGYNLAGYGYSTGLVYPTQTTMLIANGNDPYALAPPYNYKKVWALEASETAQSLFSKCSENHHGIHHDPTIGIKCAGLSSSIPPSYGNFSQGFDLQQIFDTAAVYFWKPLPAPGYQCLGHIASNGGGNRPVTVLDAAQNPGLLPSQLYAISAMYCVAKTYVVPGKIGPLLFKSHDSTLLVYQIIAADNVGYNDGNLFYAQSCPSGIVSNCPITETVYVLNQNSIYNSGGVGPTGTVTPAP